jgi:hypothetical protein
MSIPQVFKNRKAAHDYLVAEGVPVSRGKFYEDADRLRVVQPDKTVQLSDLMAYVKNELKLNSVTGQSIGEIDRGREREEWELRKLKADVKAREDANRKDDDSWIPREESEIQRAALLGLAYDTVKHHLGMEDRRILHAVGADPARAVELTIVLEEIIDAAFNEIASRRNVEAEFLEE